jgi:predicted Zn-dependent peptidase
MEHKEINVSSDFENKLVDYLQSIGVNKHLNAYTSFDEMVYFFQFLP